MAFSPGRKRKRKLSETFESHDEPPRIGSRRTRGAAIVQRHRLFGKLLAIPEMLSVVICYLSLGDLSRLCQTSKSLDALLRPFLYETVPLDGMNWKAGKSLLGNSSLVHTRHISVYSTNNNPLAPYRRYDQHLNNSRRMMKILANIPSLKSFRWVDAPCAVFTTAGLEQSGACLDRLAISYAPLRWTLPMNYANQFLMVPSFAVAKNWSLTSLVLINMPPFPKAWHDPLKQLLLSSPNLSTLCLGFFSAPKYIIVKGSNELEWVRGGTTGFLGELCHACAWSDRRPLSLKKLHLFDGFSVCGATCRNTTQNLQYLQQLIDLSCVEDLHIWNDPEVAAYQPANITASLGILNMQVMPRLGRLSFNQWNPPVTTWLHHSNPSFIQQLFLISDDEHEPWLKLPSPGTPAIMPCPRMLRLKSNGLHLRRYEHTPSFMEVMSMLEDRCNLVSGLWFRSEWYRPRIGPNEDSIPLLVDRLVDGLSQMPNLEELVLDLPIPFTRSVEGPDAGRAKIATRILEVATPRLKYLAFGSSSSSYFGSGDPRIEPFPATGDFAPHMQVSATLLRGAVWRVSRRDEDGVSTPVLMKMDEEDVRNVELFREASPVFPDITPREISLLPRME